MKPAIPGIQGWRFIYSTTAAPRYKRIFLLNQKLILIRYRFSTMSTVFSRVFRRKNPDIIKGLSGRAARSWLTFWLPFLQIAFSRKVFNLRASNSTHGFFRVSAFI